MNVKPVHERLVVAAKTEDEFVFYSEVIKLGGLSHLGGDALSGALGRLLYQVDQYDWEQEPGAPDAFSHRG